MRLQPDLNFQVTTVNGQAGLVARDGAAHTLTVTSVAITKQRDAQQLIERVWATRNPGKLTGWM